ncbi:TspO/MBR-related protein, partial [Coprinopsis sp. MPI-PUGE-AT-0042]
MGYTAHRFYTTGITSLNPGTVALARYGASLYTLQLGLNLLWTPLFFGFNKPILAAVDIVALGGTVGYMAYTYGEVDKTCAWLSVPYLGWLSFATYLCIGVGHLNGWDLTKAQGKG